MSILPSAGLWGSSAQAFEVDEKLAMLPYRIVVSCRSNLGDGSSEAMMLCCIDIVRGT